MITMRDCAPVDHAFYYYCRKYILTFIFCLTIIVYNFRGNTRSLYGCTEHIFKICKFCFLAQYNLASRLDTVFDSCTRIFTAT